MLIVNAIPYDRGWSPIQHMVSIAGEMFECQVVAADTSRPSKATKILSVLRERVRNETSNEICLLICPSPADLVAILNMENWRKRFRYLAAWIIDSFWVDHIPAAIRLRNPFDHLFITSLEDIDQWRKITGAATTWLPWGTDALGLGHSGTRREWDLMRVGRQPPEWDDDVEVGLAAKSFGIKHRGRPDSTGLNALQNQKLMMNAYASSKFILAFSNVVNCDPNNHPTREYLTGRWVDALGCGCIVAGVVPRGASSEELLWGGATLELGSVQRREGLRVIDAALRQWTPDIAAANYQMALKCLDWRWRFKLLAQVLQVRSLRLAQELQLLETRIAGLSVSANLV